MSGYEGIRSVERRHMPNPFEITLATGDVAKIIVRHDRTGCFLAVYDSDSQEDPLIQARLSPAEIRNLRLAINKEP
jgi:hypothetical protein